MLYIFHIWNSSIFEQFDTEHKIVSIFIIFNHHLLFMVCENRNWKSLRWIKLESQVIWRLIHIYYMALRLMSFFWFVLFISFPYCVFRYEMASNRWVEESRVPRKSPFNSSYGLVALNGELYVISLMKTESAEARRLRHHKKGGTLYMQIYNPQKKTWRSLVTRSPFHHPMDFDTAAMCTVRMWNVNTYLCNQLLTELGRCWLLFSAIPFMYMFRNIYREPFFLLPGNKFINTTFVYAWYFYVKSFHTAYLGIIPESVCVFMSSLHNRTLKWSCNEPKSKHGWKEN